MKSFSKIVFTAVLVLALAMTMTACSSGGGGGSAPVTTTPTTTTGGGTVQNVPATQQASTGTQAANMGTGSTTMFQSMGLSQTVGAPKFKIGSKAISSPVLQKAAKFSGKLAKAPGVSAAAAKLKARTFNAPATSGTATCTGGGTVSYSLTGTQTGGTLTMTFDTCREDGTETTGNVAVTIATSGTGTAVAVTYTESMGTASNRLVMLAFSDNTYSVMTSMLSSAITLSISGTSTSANMSANGDMIITDYTSGGDVYTMAYNQTTFGISETTSGSAVTDVTTLGGGISESWTPAGGSLHNFSLIFSSFTVTDVYASATAVAYDESISGGMTIAMTPADCGDGAFTFTTDTPVHYDASGIPQSGQMTISATKSGTTTVVRVIFTGNGLITIAEKQADGTFTTIQSNVDPYSLANLCGLETPNEPAPVSSGSTGTVSANASNAAMTTTLSWDSPTSDMDLHLVHLTSVPTSTTIYDYDLTSSGATADSNWHLYFGSASGTGTEEYVGTSSDKVAVLDVDDMDGYGPEHITMDAPLPVGYYIIYIDPWSMDADLQSTVTVKLQIGSQLFSAPAHQFTSSSDAVYRAFDFTVDASGNVTVGSPNTGITIYSTPPALRARKF